MEKFKYDETTGTIVGYTLEGAVHGIGGILNVKVDYSKSLFNPRVSKVVTDKGVIKLLNPKRLNRKLKKSFISLLNCPTSFTLNHYTKKMKKRKVGRSLIFMLRVLGSNSMAVRSFQI